jgi:hypothetical protein
MSNNNRYIQAVEEAAQLLAKIEKAAADKVYQYDEDERVQTIDNADVALDVLEYVTGRIKSIRRTMLSTDVTAYK